MYQCPSQYPQYDPWGMYGMPGMYMDCYEDCRRLMDMYPDCYKRIYPKVQEICHRMDVPTNPRMYPYVDPAMVEEMVDQIYEMEVGEANSQQRGIFRDLITILILRQLLRRRRRRRYGFDGYY